MNIILVSHEFSPIRGSECAVGWNFCIELSKYNKIFVIYADTNQFNTISYTNDINEHILKNKLLLNNITLIPVSQPLFARFFSFINNKVLLNKFSVGFKPFFFLALKFWEFKAFIIARKLLITNKIDILHKLTPISFRTGAIWPLLSIPVVIGPTSGVSNVPFGFYNKLSYKAIFNDLLRRFSIFYIKNISFLEKFKRNQVKGIIVVSNYDEYYYSKYVKNLIKIPEVGCTNFINPITQTHSPERILKFISIGRFDEFKSYDILFEVVDKIVFDFELTIIGNGPQKQYLLEKYNDIIKSKNIRFLDSVTREEIFSILSESDLLIHTSIKEATSSVVMEALSVSTPVLCHNSFSLEYVIDSTCGFKVDLISTEYSIQGFTNILNKLAQHPNSLFKMRDSTFKKSIHYSWENLGINVTNLYTKILNEDSYCS